MFGYVLSYHWIIFENRFWWSMRVEQKQKKVFAASLGTQRWRVILNLVLNFNLLVLLKPKSQRQLKLLYLFPKGGVQSAQMTVRRLVHQRLIV